MSYITPKTTRGVQEQDVWAAADAVLLQGERPTIERVRQHMGRGSPNTVGPMLESWFGRLGQRLSAAENEAQGDALLPQVVQEAALALWQAACKQAQVAAQTALQDQHTALAQAQEALAAREARLAQGELNLQQQKQGLDAALKLAQDQQADLSERLAAMQQQLEQREAQLTAQRQEWDELQQQRDAERRQHSTALEAAAQERQRLAEQFSGNEKRWLGELDRSRQEVEKLKKQQQQAAQDAQALVAEMRSRQAQLETEALAAQSVLATTQHSLHLANERIEELKIQLQQRPLPDAPALRSSSPSLQRRALAQKSLARRR
ncbi:MAG TPA: DNA-binding protein [Comamonas denitrificans]|nr:DNA-binding protein [Comamonas denitrificans]